MAVSAPNLPSIDPEEDLDEPGVSSEIINQINSPEEEVMPGIIDQINQTSEPVQQDLPDKAERARGNLDKDEQVQSSRDKDKSTKINELRQRSQSPEEINQKRGWFNNTLSRLQKGKQIADDPQNKSGSPNSSSVNNIGHEENGGSRLQEFKEQEKEKAKHEIENKAKQEVKKVVSSLLKKAATGLLDFLAAYVEIWGPILLGIIGVVAVIFALYGVYNYILGGSGAGAARLPTTQAQKDQATLLAGLSGDVSSNIVTITKQANTIKSQLASLKTKAGQVYPAAKAAAFDNQADAITVLADQLIAGAGNPNIRTKVVAEINQSINNLENAYPEIVASPGDCASLATYIQSGQLKFGHAITQRDIVTGHDVNSAGQTVPVSASLCNIISWIIQQGHTITVGTLANGHSENVSSANNSSRPVSQHFVGQAMDIDVIDGSSSSSSDWLAKSTALEEQLFNNYKVLSIHQLIGPAPQFLILSENGPIPANPAGHQSLLNDHKTHIHIGVVRP